MTDDTDDFLFAQHVGLNSPDFIFAFWGSVAWVPLISFYFSGVQPHLGAPQGDEELQAISNQLLIQHQNSSFCCSQKLLLLLFIGLLFSLWSRCCSSLLFLVSSCPFSWLVVFCCLLLLFFSFLAQAPLSFCSVFVLNAHGSCSRASVPSSFG